MFDLYSMSDLVPISMAWLSAGVAVCLTNYLDTQGVEVAQDYRHTTANHVEIVQLNCIDPTMLQITISESYGKVQ